MEQRLLQLVQRSELALIEAGEALGFFTEGIELGIKPMLFRNGLGE